MWLVISAITALSSAPLEIYLHGFPSLSIAKDNSALHLTNLIAIFPPKFLNIGTLYYSFCSTDRCRMKLVFPIEYQPMECSPQPPPPGDLMLITSPTSTSIVSLPFNVNDSNPYRIKTFSPVSPCSPPW